MAPGTELADRYELVAPIASGGMAQVWSANDLVLNRQVAIKILHPHLGTDEAFVARFRREAVAAARLTHRSIVAVFDTISEPPLEAIVMELIDGRTLRAVLDEVGALPARDVIQLGVQISAALEVAHQAGIVHRDIKPANIMVGRDRRIMVTDFGIAKAGTDADLTTTGTLLGTAKYLSPEQVTGAPVDPRSDLYSLGVVLFEALTGTVPFKANTDAATALARLHQEVPLARERRPNVPLELETILTGLMARDLRDRFPRASDVAEALLKVDPDAPPGPPLSSTSGPQPADTGLSPPNAGARSHQRPASDPSRPSNLVFPSSGPVPAVTGMAPPRNHGGSGRGTGHPRPPDPPKNLSQGPPLQAGSGPSSGTLQPVPISSERVRRSGRSRLSALFVSTLILVAVGVAITQLTSFGRSGDAASVNPFDEASPGLPITQITSFDPQTSDPDKQEREDLVSLAIDGDIETAWTTESYRGRDLSGLKDGVGLLITLEERLPLNQIQLDTNTEGWKGEIYVGDSFGEDPTQWGTPAVTIDAGSNRVVRDLNRAEGQTVLIWVRDTGVSGERNRFELAEVVIK